MRRLLERIWGPLGSFRRLPSGPAGEEERWGYKPVDQRRAFRVFWKFFGAIVAVLVLGFIIILIVKISG